jgi:hypothetical protein
MGINFPNTPTTNQLYPQPPVAGLPVYRWDGQKWTTQGTAYVTKTPVYTDGSTAMTAALTLSGDPVNSTDAADKHYVDARTTPINSRNRLINGHFVIDQYNSYAAFTPASNQYVIDRWGLTMTQPSKLTTQAAEQGSNPGVPSAAVIKTASAFTSAAADYFNLSQVIEYQDVSDFAFGYGTATPITLSFSAFATIAGTYSGAIRNSAENRSYVFTFALPASVWTRVSVTIPGDTAGTWVGSQTASGMVLSFDLGCGSTFRTAPGAWAAAKYYGATGAVSLVANAGAQLILGAVQIELGSVATPFDWRSQADTLAACQRYYETGANLIYSAYLQSGYTCYTSYPFRVVKRVQPSVVISDGGVNGFPAGPASVYVVNTKTISVDKIPNITGGGNFTWGFTANADF